MHSNPCGNSSSSKSSRSGNISSPRSWQGRPPTGSAKFPNNIYGRRSLSPNDPRSRLSEEACLSIISAYLVKALGATASEPIHLEELQGVPYSLVKISNVDEDRFTLKSLLLPWSNPHCQFEMEQPLPSTFNVIFVKNQKKTTSIFALNFLEETVIYFNEFDYGSFNLKGKKILAVTWVAPKFFEQEKTKQLKEESHISEETKTTHPQFERLETEMGETKVKVDDLTVKVDNLTVKVDELTEGMVSILGFVKSMEKKEAKRKAKKKEEKKKKKDLEDEEERSRLDQIHKKEEEEKAKAFHEDYSGNARN